MSQGCIFQLLLCNGKANSPQASLGSRIIVGICQDSGQLLGSTPTVCGSTHQVRTIAARIKLKICDTLTVVLVPSTVRGLYIVLAVALWQAVDPGIVLRPVCIRRVVAATASRTGMRCVEFEYG